YSFTVVATDAAGNASTKDVTLAVNNLDEIPPSVTLLPFSSQIKLEPAGVTGGNDQVPQITALGNDGAFVVTWSGQNAGGDFSIFVQRFDSTGSAVGSPILLEPTGVTSGNDSNPQITALGSDGAFVVTWYGPDANTGGDLSILVQRCDGTGVALGKRLRLAGGRIRGQD